MTSILKHRTVTPNPQHLLMVELEADTGYRFWTKVAENDLGTFLTQATEDGYGLSDQDCSLLCSHPEHHKDEQFMKWHAEAKEARRQERRDNGYPGYSRKGFCKTHTIARCTICL